MDWSIIRAEFPALSAWTYLNTATFGQLPRRAAEAVAGHFSHRDELACSDFLTWFDDADEIRGLVARLIHCSAADIAFITNAAAALALLIGSIDWREGDRIVTLQDEFPNNLYHPALLSAQGVELVETSWEGFHQAIDSRTRLVAISEVNYTSGFRAPIGEIAKFLRGRGVLFFVDGTQSVGALQFEAGAIRPDMLAVHGYKWLLCPNGAGFMYVNPGLRERMAPNVIGWRSHRDWRRVDNLHHGAPVFKPEAEKYEGGMLPFPLLYAMKASLEMMLEIGPAAIEKRALELASKTRSMLRELGAEVPESSHFDSPIIAARFPKKDASELALRLKERRVLVSARHGNLRVSTHFYNNEEDVARLEEELKRLGA